MPQDSKVQELRRAAIRKLIRRRRLSSQGELLKHLASRGFVVTQSSVSRDLRELGVVKRDGRYGLPEAGPERTEGSADRLAELVLAWAPAGPHLLVVHTVIGGASRVGLEIDRAQWAEVLGTVAGDDTLFLATRGLREQKRVSARLTALLSKES